MKADRNNLHADLKFLTELRPFRNYQNHESLATVVSYIKQVFTDDGLEVKEQKWMVNNQEYTNVIGVFTPG